MHGTNKSGSLTKVPWQRQLPEHPEHRLPETVRLSVSPAVSFHSANKPRHDWNPASFPLHNQHPYNITAFPQVYRKKVHGQKVSRKTSRSGKDTATKGSDAFSIPIFSIH
jgi:hypothetical protein